MADFQVIDKGSVVGFAPQTDAAQDFLDEHVHVESWQWLGNFFYADHRPAQDLLDGIAAEGLTVEAI